MIWTVVLVLLALWVLGVLGKVAGNLIHFLLIAAVAVLIGKLLSGRRIA